MKLIILMTISIKGLNQRDSYGPVRDGINEGFGVKTPFKNNTKSKDRGHFVTSSKAGG